MIALAAGLVTDEPNQLTDLEIIISRILNIATSLAGLAILAMLIVGAFQFITAGADQEKLQKAKGVLTAAVIGGALLIFVWIILRFIGEFTGLNVTNFNICITDKNASLPGCQQNTVPVQPHGRQ